MVTCEVCGGENFEKHAGFMYCQICQTQSQEYHEQEFQFEYSQNDIFTSTNSPKSRVKQKKMKVYDDGVWTSWEAFNHILYGMTQELKNCGVTQDFETVVLKLWASYLKQCGVAFTSKYSENMPKLAFSFKQRDARVLYNIDVSSLSSAKRRRTSCQSSNTSHSSKSSLSSYSKKFLSVKKSKVISRDYEELLSTSMQSGSNLADETLESLGRTSETDLSTDSSNADKTIIKSMKNMLHKKDYKLYKQSYEHAGVRSRAKDSAKRNVKYAAKNKLLSILHLAALMTGCDIQLSDLLRFIREGYLSYAKVTHFLPNDFKFSKCDISYIDVISDALMPTHLNQRKISGNLAYFLKINEIPCPNVSLLIERYCKDLNLPEQICVYCENVLAKCLPTSTVPRSKSILPSYEAWAMVSIVFIMKLLFGLNDAVEIVMSKIARKANSLQNSNKLFVFEDWQKFIECRKTVLMDFHYPTMEQLNRNKIQSSGNFLNMLVKESKDEHKSQRFMHYKKYFMDEKLVNGIKQMLTSLTNHHPFESIEFQPSLTPLTSHYEMIRQNLLMIKKNDDNISKPFNIPEKILDQDFKKCDIEYVLDLEKYLTLIKEKDNKFLSDINFSSDFFTKFLNLSKEGEKSFESFYNISSKYWIHHYSNTVSGHLSNFKEEILEKTPENFQWLITECSRMLEMNVRDVYDELLRLENKIVIEK